MEHRMGCSMLDDQNDAPEQAEIPVSNETDTGQTEPVLSDLEEQKKRYEDLNERFLRLAADSENFRKRAAHERESIMQFANERFAVDILEVVDNLERAVRSDDNHLREGLTQIRELFSAILQRHGIIPIDVLTKKFDPAEHEAVAHVPSEKEEGTVIDEVARGYRMHGKVIRYAKVAVSKGKEKNSED
jgi:molecular chaperone GrpE